MIRILEKKDCCGCSACQQICPKTCIKMEPDEEGFLYPSVDEKICIDCGLCERVCPVINPEEERIPVRTLAAKNKNKVIRFKSSSGGVFSALAIKILGEDGVVFGARFDEEWNVVHDYIESVDDLHLFQGSKYVQSKIGNTYSRAEEFLNEGRKVLFSGTPCQIAGLKRFLRKKYLNLLTVDVICHGVPSPLIWRDYLSYIISQKKIKGISSLADIESISFRSKITGWKKYSIQINSKNGDEFSENFERNLYMQGFLRNIYLRPSCYACPAKKGKCGSDISLGDYWGVENFHSTFADDMGVGTILIYNDEIIENILSNVDAVDSEYINVLTSNSCIESSVRESRYTDLFWREYNRWGICALRKIIQKSKLTLVGKCVNKFSEILQFIISRKR